MRVSSFCDKNLFGSMELQLVQPLQKFVPKVVDSERNVPIKTRLIYTCLCGGLFLVFSKMPLYGIQHVALGADPFYSMRAILASSRGTLMELGISPIVTSGLIMQLLVGSKIIRVNPKEDQELLKVVQKLLGMGITLVQATACVAGGAYGTLGVTNSILVTIQLCMGGAMSLYLDELMEGGYGIGLSSSLFSAINICDNIIWEAFSPFTVNFGRGTEFEGSIVALFHGLFARRSKVQALRLAFFRRYLPNICSLIWTTIMFMVVVYLQSLTILLKTLNKRGQIGTYSIKLLYTSSMPIMLWSAVLANIQFLSQTAYKFLGPNILGTWVEHEGHLVAVGGLAHYLTPPSGLSDFFTDPVHMMVYLCFTLITCTLISRMWIEVSGASSKDVTERFIDQGQTLAGHRPCNIKKELNRYIPISAALGGLLIGIVSVVADFMGVIGSGTGILLVVSVVSHFWDAIKS